MRSPGRSKATEQAYHTDLAYIHDVGYGDFARKATPGLLALLRRHKIAAGKVIDLGCGSGIWARGLHDAGYSVVGVDISKAMIAIARRRVPGAALRSESFLATELPPCAAVTSIGECFSYLFDPSSSDRALFGLLRRIHAALRPGGLLIFDVVTPGRIPGNGRQTHCREGSDWAIMVNAQEDRRRGFLTRRITSFRKVGRYYRRSDEIHKVRCFKAPLLQKELLGIGFRVRILKGYGRMRFGAGHVGFLARKG